MPKHKHAEVIHAWADGAEVQVKWESVGWQDSKDPAWFTEWEYRIKPAEKVVRWCGLTDDEIANAVGSPLDEVYLVDFYKVIAKLKEKNHG